MASFNKVILIGHLTADPELKQTTSGLPVTSFSIGVNRRFTKQGEQPQTDFINIVCWRQTAEFVARYFTKGKPILICGSLQTRSWVDKDGNKRYTTEVVADEATFVERSRILRAAGRHPRLRHAEGRRFVRGAFADDELPFLSYCTHISGSGV
ncbi:MAG: single-stranded DNA-binding protein [Acutalibacteraceae bacterium]